MYLCTSDAQEYVLAGLNNVLKRGLVLSYHLNNSDKWVQLCKKGRFH